MTGGSGREKEGRQGDAREGEICYNRRDWGEKEKENGKENDGEGGGGNKGVIKVRRGRREDVRVGSLGGRERLSITSLS